MPGKPLRVRELDKVDSILKRTGDNMITEVWV